MFRVPQTTSHLAMEFTALQVNAYLFSTDYVNVRDIFPNLPEKETANYENNSNYIETI
jgi:nucleoside phosphorylase